MRLLLILIMGVFMSIEAKANTQETAIVAGGCFWCVESDFDKLDGVTSTVSGYIGGSAEDADYKKVSHGGTNHYEAVKITFDPARISYKELMDYFWKHIDPLDTNGQFCDKGSQYRAGIFYINDEQEQIAIKSKETAAKLLGKKIVTEILPADTFYDAEDYHQDYHETHPFRYKLYRGGCGRDKRVNALWGNK